MTFTSFIFISLDRGKKIDVTKMLIISFESKIRRVLIMVKKEESGRKGGSVIIIPPYLSATNRKNDSEALRRTRVIFFYHTNPLINLFHANPF